MVVPPPRAHYAAPPVLDSRPISRICQAHVNGFCKHAENCPLSSTHRITLIDDVLPSKTALLTALNLLSLEPRLAPVDKNAYFDDEGPGNLSLSGIPRHDNDHVLIQDIKILPTTDEVCKPS